MARCKGIPAASLVVLIAASCASGFLSGAPQGPPRGGKTSQSDVAKSKVNEKLRTMVEETAVGPSPMIETISVGSPRDGLSIDSEQARAIALEAATSKTVPKDTTLEALHCLARSSELELSTGSSDPLPMESMGGLWRLCFVDGGFLQGIEVDKHGYVSRGQEVEIMFDTEDQKVVLGSRGLQSSLPMAVRGGLSYAQATQTVTGTFDKATVGIESLELRAFLIDDDALGFLTVSQDKDCYLLFHAQKSKAAAARLSNAAATVGSPLLDAVAEEAATAKVAGQKLLDLKRGIELISWEELHEDKRVAVQETGRKTGSFNTFVRYLETEGGTIYAAVAGPAIFTFLKHYNPVALNKATAAAIVMVETVKHALKA